MPQIRCSFILGFPAKPRIVNPNTFWEDPLPTFLGLGCTDRKLKTGGIPTMVINLAKPECKRVLTGPPLLGQATHDIVQLNFETHIQ